MIIAKKTKAHNDDFETPKEIYLLCCKIWNIFPELDVCATWKNTKCLFHISKILNFLSLKDHKFKGRTIWCNPPHSMTKKFVKKLFFIWQSSNCDILILLPVNCLTSNYAKEFLLPYIEFKKEMFIGRIKFLDPVTQKPSRYNSVNGYVCVCLRQRND